MYGILRQTLHSLRYGLPVSIIYLLWASCVVRFKMADKTEEFCVDINEDEEDEDVDWNEIQAYHDYDLSSVSLLGSQIGRGTTSNEYNPKDEDSSRTSNNESSNVQTKAVGPSRMSLNDHKAGMEGLDKEKINKIIYEASKGSKFYENEMLKEQQVKERISRQTERLESFTDEDMTEAMLQADRIVKDLEKTRDLSRTIVHIDMDAFYAAVEMRDDPSLRDKPMAVGSPGMLSTSNYLARRFGVRAAMPGFIGKKLCPDLIIVPANFEKYRTASGIIRNVLKDYDPNFLPMSLDEAYLDLTDYIKERQNQNSNKRTFYKATGNPTADGSGEKFEFGNDVQEIVKEIRFRIELETQLTASAGIACNSMLAKICSDKNKPNGQFYLPPDRDAVMNFIHDLPIRKISGIGRVSEQMLKALGIATCNDLFAQRNILILLNSSISSKFLIAISLGLGSTRLESSRERKSLSTERTFTELSKPAELYSECQSICNMVAKDCNDEKLKPKTVTLKLKTVNFQVRSRSVSLSFPVTNEKDIYEAAKDLLAKEIASCESKPLRLRLMGVRLSNFESSEKKDAKQDKITSFLRKDAQEALSIESEDRQTSISNEKDSAAEGISIRGESKKTCFEAICPVCNQLQAINDDDYLEVFNKHVDLCLNSVAIKEALTEEKPSRDAPTSRGKRKHSSCRKNESHSKKVTLEQFWSK